MKKLFPLLIAGLLFISCSGLQDTGVTGELSFTCSRSALRAAASRTVGDDGDGNGNGETDVFMVSLAGEYTDSITLVLGPDDDENSDNDNETITFQNVPVGATIYVEAKLYSYIAEAGSTSLPDFSQTNPDAYGRSASVVINEGINFIPLTLFNFFGRFPFTITINSSGLSESELESLANSLSVYGIAKESSLGRSITASSSDTVKLYETLTADIDDIVSGVDLYNSNGYSNYTINGSSIIATASLYMPIDFSAPAEKGQEAFVIAAKRTENTATNPVTYKTKYFGQSASLIPYKTTTNTASLTISKMDIIDTPVVTYSRSTNTYYIKVDGDSDFDASNVLYCFDTEENVYFLTNSRNSIKSTNKNSELDCSGLIPDGITYDFAQKKFYVYKLVQAELDLYDITDAINSWDYTQLPQAATKVINFSETDNTLSSFNHKIITVDNGILYDVGRNTNGSGDFRFVVSTLSNWTDPTAIGQPDRVVDLQLDSLNLEEDYNITDIICSDGMVYLLLRDYIDMMSTRTYMASNPFRIKSHGAIIRYKPSNNEVTMLGWTNNTLDNTGKYLYAYYNDNGNKQLYSDDNLQNKVKITTSSDSITERFPTLCSPSAMNSKQFFGPQKFIAIKPKKLVIADDGYMFYSDSEGVIHYKNANRIVTVDLKDFAIIDTESTSDAFDMEKNGAIYSSAFDQISQVFTQTLYYDNAGTSTSALSNQYFNVGILPED